MRTLDEGLRLKQQLIEEGVLLWREKQVKKNFLQKFQLLYGMCLKTTRKVDQFVFTLELSRRLSTAPTSGENLDNFCDFEFRGYKTITELINSEAVFLKAKS